jgi:hypothetical protein
MHPTKFAKVQNVVKIMKKVNHDDFHENWAFFSKTTWFLFPLECGGESDVNLWVHPVQCLSLLHDASSIPFLFPRCKLRFSSFGRAPAALLGTPCFCCSARHPGASSSLWRHWTVLSCCRWCASFLWLPRPRCPAHAFHRQVM